MSRNIPRLPSLDSLFDEQRRLQVEASRITQRLTEINQQILYLLARHAQIETRHERPVTVVSEKTAPVRAAKHAAPAAPAAPAAGNGMTRQKWFDRGETGRLIERVLKGPMRPAEIVHAVMDAKGYAKTLAAPDRKKAEAALHQAVITAVRARKLVRDAKGLVRPARGTGK